MRFILMFKYLLIENYQARLLNAKALSEYLTLLVSITLLHRPKDHTNGMVIREWCMA